MKGNEGLVYRKQIVSVRGNTETLSCRKPIGRRKDNQPRMIVEQNKNEKGERKIWKEESLSISGDQKSPDLRKDIPEVKQNNNVEVRRVSYLYIAIPRGLFLGAST